MSQKPTIQKSASLSNVLERLGNARASLGRASRELSLLREADPSLSEAECDLAELEKQIDSAILKLGLAASSARRGESVEELKAPVGPSSRRLIEDECLRVFAEGRERHGDQLCRFLGVSPTLEPGLAMYQLYERFMAESRPRYFRTEIGDVFIREFLDFLKSKIASAENHLAEDVSPIGFRPAASCKIPKNR